MGILRRTKTTGTDKNVSARPVRVDASSFISSPQWLSSGWKILCELAPIQKGLSPSSPSRSLRQLSSDRAQVRAGQRHPESSVGELGRQQGCQSAHSRSHGVLDPSLGEVIPPELYDGFGVPKGGTRSLWRVVSPGERHLREDGEAPHLVNMDFCFESHCPGTRRRQAWRV